MHRILAAVLSLSIALPTPLWSADVQKLKIPADTRIYVSLSEEVIGKKKFTHEGQPVRAKVWRDVVIEGNIVIKAGTPVLVRVDRLKKAKVAGIKGQLELGAYETSTVDGQGIQLTGGYMKKGKGRIALSASLAGLVFLPLIFMKGKAAKLPEGTVFDSYTGLDFHVAVQGDAAPRIVNLAGVVSDFRVEVLYEALEKQEKPKYFDFLVYAPVDAPDEFFIDRINDGPTDPIPLNVLSRESHGDEAVIRVNVGIKTLAKRFTKGVNRFDVACNVEGERMASEVVLNIQF